MKRPTIGLCVIAKNEENNIKHLTESIEGCFDKLYLTDTGSEDNTVELAEELGWEVSHFEWVDDFAAARNASLDRATTDFIMWMDLDDVLVNKEAFIKWRNTALEHSDYWLATYDYASDLEGRPTVSFARERVFKRELNPRFKFFIHEGVEIQPGSRVQYATTWKIKHRRTPEDIKADQGRNLKIFRKHLANDDEKFPSRMKYYYGKELFEANYTKEAYEMLKEACGAPDLQQHDKALAIQYAGFAALRIGLFDKAIEAGFAGLLLDNSRAEYWITIADAFVQQQKIREAIPFYRGAMYTAQSGLPSQTYASPIFSIEDTSTRYPRNQLLRCYFHLGEYQKGLDLAAETMKLFPNEETIGLTKELERASQILGSRTEAKQVEDIVISCPPVGMYEWDEEVYQTKGMGGSETAAIEMAANLRKLTKRDVIIFNQRKTRMLAKSGVEYRPTSELNDYMSHYKPRVHIAWRHNVKCTDAKTYLWCHDLTTPTVEQVQNFDKIICLTDFHKRYVESMQGVPEEKIFVSRNGIVPERFSNEAGHIAKDPMKIVFPSSPDRGLEAAILILDRVREKYPIELHVFYGFDNLYKSGPQMSALADKLSAMIKDRTWIIYHGNTEQKALTDHLRSASLWVHPANFIETFCITAIEMLCAGVYPITRSLGALQDTLKKAANEGMATLIDELPVTEGQIAMWSGLVLSAIENKLWEKVTVNPQDYSWEAVAKEWIKEMGL